MSAMSRINFEHTVEPINNAELRQATHDTELDVLSVIIFDKPQQGWLTSVKQVGFVDYVAVYRRERDGSIYCGCECKDATCRHTRAFLKARAERILVHDGSSI